jgi:hypothetical protein
LIITISDTCKNQPKRLDFDNTINLSSLIVILDGDNTFCCLTPGLLAVLLVISPSFLTGRVAMAFFVVSWGWAAAVLLRE